ncbi:aldehyde dehydrogenase, dimeric NADP-preferring-like [Paramacrobiotus metropolitanus]|uniref:aldehyde dehydrogenase, dimeric NADP-preferring-like n=1 Tax=Paramacrobiotus metropolitanus TaxID=2943436 RepID=UPI00244648C1|nr:aldehyde dehydrogenase, dimeric NADP-preferring-like [Paramacrobiotus metropolitanus]XP_055353741.1 aldehyde dehydrogenase, dimeric NADP-preferring-like [Paramacrobiotus metropolitanus]
MRLSPSQNGDTNSGHPKVIVERLNAAFRTGKTRSYDFRKAQLTQLLRFFDENTDTLCEALWKDLHKPRQEAILTEIEIVKNEIRKCLHDLKKWMGPHPVEKSISTLMDNPYILYEPYGTVLIIGAWNYPVNLLLSPMVGAIAAGNCVLLKPSEVSENTERTIEQLLPRYLDKDCFEVVCAGPEDTGRILKEKFDYIFYTGSTMVGKIVYEAAAKHLTPVTLELGGKSPVFVDSTADMYLTAKRIMWGKNLNAGQTCIAPDYVLCTPAVQGKLVDAMKKASKDLLADPKQAPDFCRIVSTRQFDRLKGLLEQQNVAFGGDVDTTSRYISPTVLRDVDPESPVMKQEIFGPILPIVPVKDIDSAINFVNSGEKPLALYVFTNDNNVSDKILRQTTSGGACINDVIMHCAVDALPFGGVGSSGIGSYHGFSSFETFSHKRSVLQKKLGWDFLLASRYPPYSNSKINTTTALLKYRPALPKWLGTAIVFGAGALSGYVLRLLTNPQQLPREVREVVYGDVPMHDGM